MVDLSNPLDIRWRVPVGLDLQFRAVGDSVAVLNPESGDTHVVTSEGAACLRTLFALPGTYPRDMKGLERQTLPFGGTESLIEAVRQFHRLGLIEPVTER